jgi:hypothetical protein
VPHVAEHPMHDVHYGMLLAGLATSCRAHARCTHNTAQAAPVHPLAAPALTQPTCSQPPPPVAQPAAPCKSIKCGTTCCKTPANALASCAALGKCTFACRAGFTSCNGGCHQAPFPNSVGFCQDGKVFKVQCKPLFTLCKASCVPYPSLAVNIKCDPLKGTITFKCPAGTLNCKNALCCVAPTHAVPLCLRNSLHHPTCGFRCKAMYKKCNNNTRCCKVA